MVMVNVVEMATKALMNGLPWFAIQWHITAKCEQKCQHCYSINSLRYSHDLEKELSLNDCILIVDSVIEFCSRAHAYPVFFITGGDPLLRQDFWELLNYFHSKEIPCHIMGNPNYLTMNCINQLLSLGVKSYQLSLDGLENTHDLIRGSGSFNFTVDGIKKLVSSSLRSIVMFTVSKINVQDLIPTYRFVSELGVDLFSFARYVPSLSTIAKEDFTPIQYKNVLLAIQRESKELYSHGNKTKLSHKDNLWKLLLYEQGEYKIKDNPAKQIISGCHIGKSNLTILPDGSVYACRRFESFIGKLPEQSVAEIFTSPALMYYRQYSNFKACVHCPLHFECRGCPAVAFAHSNGDFYAPDPQCWRNTVTRPYL